ncbi:MAG: DNA primase [Alphaproteobacteria bacterium]
MAFSPDFLDELRGRVGLADVIARRVKLTRKGREHGGLCPFHSEKTPSFTVSEEKGFYHCFGCGAHGDVIGFVMQTEGVSFPEAVERLAAEAGIAVPVSTPEERQRAERQATLLQVMEAACAWFESQLRAPAGRTARDYLAGRGLDDDTIARFRLGFAPDSRSGLRTALMGATISEAQLVETGMLIRPEDGGAPYDRFRGRVMFPITDVRGRTIAFGARILGDGQPKYLNSPDTPLFNKGRVLYGMATARRAAHDSGRVIVCEGYTDVIALARVGINEAVAPLGTAITETQIEMLWRMAAEPVLCLDGDEAGKRAAKRVAERALPLLKPGYSLSFTTLAPGQDPDSLVKAGGAAAMEEVLAVARPLDQLIWEIEVGTGNLDTPERRAGLEQRLETQAFAIADRKVQQQYLAHFRQRLRSLGQERRGFQGRKPGREGGVQARGGPAGGAVILRSAPESLRRRREQVLAATVVNHISILDNYAEAFGGVVLSDPALDKLRQEILMIYASDPHLDNERLRSHLLGQGFTNVLAVVLGPEVYGHGGFARPEAGPGAAGAGFEQLVFGLSAPDRAAQLAEAEKAFADDPTEENWGRLEKSMSFIHQQQELDEGMTAESERTEESAAVKALST